MKQFELPQAPPDQTGTVKACSRASVEMRSVNGSGYTRPLLPWYTWSEPVVISTYHPMPPDKNPMFLEKR